ncbi:50S ribosomal protein L22 [Desulfohalobiaceae bacterium Ax17]|uniref:50S ribosomal protein L22 n=1 Tax=Desulfovulcanus ferrireducens TaxID=2831190 RepID=UPI00207BC3FB|nr:50S ribosomal protein L22 [Desulfovulcanus ferrireducens]MBT8762887.1 50S ribosomal protein L22 [Desulfovulcanus ferrireducens]
MEAKATAKYVRISPRKARLVAEIIKGKPVEEALNILKFTPKKAARIINKVLNSALANAEQNYSLDIDNLYVKQVRVDGGPSWKRIQPRAMGRAYRILKRTSHITVIVDEL